MNRRLQLLFKFLCIIIVNYCCSMQNFGGQIQQLGQVPQRANFVRVGQATAANHIDIDDWDNAQLGNVANDIFPANAFGTGIDNGRVISEMVDLFMNYQGQPHIALMRVVVVGENEEILYKEKIPYVFVSGKNGVTAIERWRRGVDERWRRGFEERWINLYNSIYKYSMSDKNLIKGIGDYGFECSNDGYYQFFAHSERACILCLLYDTDYSICNIMKNSGQKYDDVGKVVIQIKLIKNVPCDNCCNFLNCKSYIIGKQFVPKSLYTFNVIGLLKEQISAALRLVETRRFTRDMTKSILIEFRFSSNNGQPIETWLTVARKK